MTPAALDHDAAGAEPVAVAADCLARGNLVVFPTETLYGLGADAFAPAALQRLVDLKGREPGKPILVLLAHRSMLRDLVVDVPPLARVLIRRFWPGPLTVILTARPTLSDLLTGGTTSIGVRWSGHPIATSLVAALGRPVTAPSANPAGRPPPRDVAEARAYFGGRVASYLDGGTLAGSPSTVVDVRDGLHVIRVGAIAMKDIEASLQDGE